MNKTKNLNLVLESLNKLKSKKYKNKFFVPGLWLNDKPNPIEVNPFHFFINQINLIHKYKSDNNHLKDRNIYNLFVRLTTAYDHNRDNSLINNESGFKETGTFLKSIALLPYLKNIGINTIYLLPVTSIGEDEKKGNLGSPYAIRNPYKIDENLSEPQLGLDIETEFKAFSEAIHLLGMELVCEFVFRTASVDSDLALEHPDWFYWLNNKVKNREVNDSSEAKYGPPIFLKKELDKIKKQISDDDFNDLVPPHEQYKKMFTEPPKKVARVDGKIRGLLGDKKTEVRIPGAFADWPPDDNQPLWSDVTYLKLYENSKFNYIAYNTVRMYDCELRKSGSEIKELWNFISEIIPHHINEFGIDGVMIDMGHALPSELRQSIVNKALIASPNFYFWEENFTISQKSVDDGYSAVLGYFPFDAHKPDKLKDLIHKFSKKKFPVNFFLTSENHNTPRSFSRIQNVEFLKSIYTFSLFLPALTFIHSGFELCEHQPVNTGLDFSSKEIESFPPDKLGLFSTMSYQWDNNNEITEYIKTINKIKKENIKEPDNIFENDIQLIESNYADTISFLRREKSTFNEILIIGNFSLEIRDNIILNSLAGVRKLLDLSKSDEIEIKNDKCTITLESYKVKVFKLLY